MTTFSFILPSTPTPTDLGMTEETDLGTRAVSYALWQYLEQPRFTAMLRALCDAVQPLESLAFDVRNGFLLTSAVGVQLDILGKIVGETRGELVDGAFRVLIKARILANNCSGQPEQMYAVLALLDTDSFALREYPPAAYSVEVLGATYPDIYYRILDYMKPAGVALHYVYSEYDSLETFMFSETYATSETDADTGFGSTYSASTGGYFAGVLS